MADSLKITSVTSSSPQETPISHDFLPQPPFRFIVVGASYSGKSNMIKYMLTNDNFGYRQYFGENIIVFSKTLGMDETWTSLRLPKSHYYKEWNDDIVKEIMEYSRKQPRGVLLLLDDLISDTGAFNKRNGNLLTELFFCGRHFGITLILTTQKLLAVPSGMLTNCSHMAVFRLKTKRELDGFLENVNSIDDLPQKYKYSTEKQFSFLYMDFTKNKAYRCFEEEL
jgi:hypothetical protein